MSKKILKYFIFLCAGFAVFNLLWLLAALALDIPALPSPQAVYASYSRAVKGGIYLHFWASMWRAVISLCISLVLGLLVGIAMGHSKKVNRLFAPLLYFSYPIPKLALIPIIMLLFGIGELPKIIIIVLIIVFQIIISVRDAVQAIPKEKYAMLTSLGASRLDKLRHITLPAILPQLFSALRVSIGIAFSALFFTETFGTDRGLGFYITDCWMRPNYKLMYFGILVLSLSGLLLFIIVDVAEKLMCRWNRR